MLEYILLFRPLRFLLLQFEKMFTKLNTSTYNIHGAVGEKDNNKVA